MQVGQARIGAIESGLDPSPEDKEWRGSTMIGSTARILSHTTSKFAKGEH